MKKWIHCKNCSEKYSSELKRCPFCNTRTPLSLWKKCLITLLILILTIVTVGIVLKSVEKGHEDKKDSGRDIAPIESHVGDEKEQNDSEVENDNTESKTESTNDNITVPKPDNDKPKSQEQKQEPEPQIPQNEENGVQTADIVLPAFFDATEGLNRCKEYAPLTYTVLLSCMNKTTSDYNRQFNGDYLLEVGGNTDRIMLYRYRMRFDFADVEGAKAKCEKYLDDNTDVIKSQLALYKKTMPEIVGIMVIFEHDESNLTLTSRTFK